MKTMEIRTAEITEAVRKKTPLVHQITNYVTVNDCANITICAGGSPIMSDSIHDVEDMVAVSDCLILNIGTLNENTVRSMIAAGKAANSAGIPVLFDPVGAGATPFRSETADKILKNVKLDIIKGNEGEIGFLSGMGGKVRGVDSAGSDSPAEAVREVSRKWRCTAVSTGQVDRVCGNGMYAELGNGTPLLSLITGSGCMASAVVGCCLGSWDNPFEAAVGGITSYNIAGEIAAEKSAGPGTFRQLLFDAMYHQKSYDLEEREKILEIRRI